MTRWRWEPVASGRPSPLRRERAPGDGAPGAPPAAAPDAREGVRPVADATRRPPLVLLLSRLLIPLVGLLGLVAVRQLYQHYPTLDGVYSDGEGYYAYLPAVLVDHDPSLRAVVQRHFLVQQGQGLPPPASRGITFQPQTGSWLDKYPIGTAVMMSPAFGAGHAVAVIRGADADGYSSAEMRITAAGALLYGLAGLALLRRLLLRRFTHGAVLATLAAVVFGTDLFHYMTWEGAMSHAYSFFLLTALLWAVEGWSGRPASWGRALLVGLVAGLVVLVRPTNVVMLTVIPLFGVTSRRSLRARAALLRRNAARVGAMVAVSAAVLLPQLAEWHAATGSWIVDSYPGNEHFDVLHPHLLDTLISLRPHGVLPYAPVLALAVAAIPLLRRRAPEYLLPVAVITVADFFIIASWYQWWYGEGFGQRGFIDLLPFLALPLAALFDRAGSLWARLAVGATAAACVGATVMEMLHYWNGYSSTGVDAGEYLRALIGR